MANWITHMMVADRVYPQINGLDYRGFCIGNIAPDCNLENEDWTAFTPPREVTHWMSSDRKNESDCERFRQERIDGVRFASAEERSFYLGYYAHLLTDAHFQRFTRDERRVRAMFGRLRAKPAAAQMLHGVPDDYDAIKRVFGKKARMRDIAQIEYEYIRENPRSAYLTVLRTTTEFSDYPEFLPKGAIVRKLRVMATLPEPVTDAEFLFVSRDEYRDFLEEICAEVIDKISRVGI